MMVMRGAVSFRKRAGKEFMRFAVGLLVAYTAIAAILIFAAGIPLVGALILGVIFVPVMASLLAVLTVGVGGVGDPRPDDSRPYHYDPGSDPTPRSGAGYGASGGGHGSGDGGHGGANCGGW